MVPHIAVSSPRADLLEIEVERDEEGDCAMSRLVQRDGAMPAASRPSSTRERNV